MNQSQPNIPTRSTYSRCCSWCHAMNVYTGLPVTCPDCGHRADVSRMACDCPVCLGTAPEPVVDLDAITADLEAMGAHPSQSTGHYLLTSGTRHLGQFPTLNDAAAVAAATSERQWLDMAIWSHEGELLAIWKDGELVSLAGHYSTAEPDDDCSGYLGSF